MSKVHDGSPFSANLRLVIGLAIGVAGCGRLGYEELDIAQTTSHPSVSADAEAANGGAGGAPTTVDASYAQSSGGRPDATPFGSGGSVAATDGGGSGGRNGTVDASDGSARAACSPTNGGTEMCDGLDNDCNGVVDDASACRTSCTGTSFGGHPYAFCKTARGWNEAEADCIAQGMRLTRIDDASENQFVYDTAFRGYSGKNTFTIWPWLGATDVGTPGQWRWPDGTSFWSGQQNGSLIGGLYAHWLTSAPSDSAGTACALLQFASSNWKDAQCVSLQPYVCEGY